MDRYERFKSHVSDIAAEFRKLNKNETVRIISHLDCDGICASAILIKALNRDNRKYSISIVQQLSDNILKELKQEEYSYYVFTDLGSGQLSGINRFLKNRKVFVLDHHEPEDFTSDDIYHLNPHLFKIDGSKEIAGAGVVYFFTTQLNRKNEDMSHIAIIGAIGDVQEHTGFLKLNQEILETAINNKKLKVNKGLRMFGSQTRPLHKVLEYSRDINIPGVSGSESGSIQFLQHIGINPKIGNEWKKLSHLTEDEKKRLATAIIMKRLDEQNPEDVFGHTYTLPEEQEDSPLRDAREFSTLLNACGRLNKASLGIGTCLGNKKTKQKAIQNLHNYRREITKAIKWFNENNDPENIIKEDGFIIINAQDNILSTMIGTLASILAKSGEIADNTYIMSLAQSLDGTTKVSLRIAGNKISKDIDLRDVMKSIVSKVGGEAGGHAQAAGAIIPTTEEEKFIGIAKNTLRRLAIEEKVN
jgi:RecJ-like exonuclease